MVLNPDGTPNPLPIIDVYGTRRGPKKKVDADGNPITVPGMNLSPENSLGAPPNGPPGGPPESPGSPDVRTSTTTQAPRFPLVPPYILAQMQMQMQSLNQSSPTRIAQVPPFNHEDYSPIRRSNERGDSSEMEEDDRPRSLNGPENSGSLKEKFKCAICDFETVSHDIYRNHMVLHAAKDQDSPPPPHSSIAPSPHLTAPSISLPQYPLQIRSPLAINAEAKAAAAAVAASALLKQRSSNSTRPESGAESPSSSNNIKLEDKSLESNPNPSDYFEYLKKVAPLFKHTMSSQNPAISGGNGTAGSPSGISSTQQTGSPPLNSTSELISRLYFRYVHLEILKVTNALKCKLLYLSFLYLSATWLKD